MRYTLGLLIAIAALGLIGLGESEAACRAAGEYRVTGPTSGGYATLVETSANASSSSGTAALTLGPKRGCSVCSTGSRTLTGEYYTAPSWDGSCVLILKVFDPVSSKTGEVDGTLAFGGAVILFEFSALQESIPTFLDPDLNLTLGIRTDSLLRP